MKRDDGTYDKLLGRASERVKHLRPRGKRTANKRARKRVQRILSSNREPSLIYQMRYECRLVDQDVYNESQDFVYKP